MVKRDEENEYNKANRKLHHFELSDLSLWAQHFNTTLLFVL